MPNAAKPMKLKPAMRESFSADFKLSSIALTTPRNFSRSSGGNTRSVRNGAEQYLHTAPERDTAAPQPGHCICRFSIPSPDW